MKKLTITLTLLLLSVATALCQDGKKEQYPVPALSVRTNVVHWLMGSPNAGLEWRATESFGVLMSGAWTHLNWQSDERHFRHYKFNPELRFYMGESRRFYLGAECHFGQFNFKFNDNGRQGDFVGGGLSLGYRLPVKPKFAIDFNLGLGATSLDYEKYEYIDGVNVRRSSSEKTTIMGVNQFGIVLAWKLF